MIKKRVPRKEEHFYHKSRYELLKKWHRVERLVFPVPSVAFDGEDGGLQLRGNIQRKVVKELFPVDGIQISETAKQE